MEIYPFFTFLKCIYISYIKAIPKQPPPPLRLSERKRVQLFYLFSPGFFLSAFFSNYPFAFLCLAHTFTLHIVVRRTRLCGHVYGFCNGVFKYLVKHSFRKPTPGKSCLQDILPPLGKKCDGRLFTLRSIELSPVDMNFHLGTSPRLGNEEKNRFRKK